MDSTGENALESLHLGIIISQAAASGSPYTQLKDFCSYNASGLLVCSISIA